MARKQISFPVSDKEHAEIKALAAKERRTIKQLVLDAFDRLYPDWAKKEEKKEK